MRMTVNRNAEFDRSKLWLINMPLMKKNVPTARVPEKFRFTMCREPLSLEVGGAGLRRDYLLLGLAPRYLGLAPRYLSLVPGPRVGIYVAAVHVHAVR